MSKDVGMDPLELYSRNNGHQEDDVKVEEILQYALTHGIVYGLKPTQTIAGVDSKASVVHAPVTTRPYCIPEDAFRKGVFLAPLINHVMNKIARDYSWLTKTLAVTIKSDDFTAKLMEVFETVHREGIRQTYMLGILRSDYMIHSADGDPRNLLQVEINTIASSFGALSTHISNMHRHICRIQHDRLPKNFALDDLANALRGAKTAYESNDQKANEENDRRADSIILMIVQPGERNFSDQCLLQFEVIERKFERCIRCTLEEVYKFGAVRESDGKLIIHGHLVGVVYFRAGYTPEDYYFPEAWATRLMIERSDAIKCPSIGLHLAGCKKVQQALADPGELEKFLEDEEACRSLREVFAGLYSLDGDSGSQKRKRDEDAKAPYSLSELKAKVFENPNAYVMKPQREGGGNNLYGDDVAHALRTMSDSEISAYILMERILPPSQSATLLRDGETFDDECLCELGIFGTFISKDSDLKYSQVPKENRNYDDSEFISKDSDLKYSQVPKESRNYDDGEFALRPRPLSIKRNEYGGYLLRVKPASTNEGGVAAGYSVLSSPKLVSNNSI